MQGVHLLLLACDERFGVSMVTASKMVHGDTCVPPWQRISTGVLHRQINCSTSGAARRKLNFRLVLGCYKCGDRLGQEKLTAPKCMEIDKNEKIYIVVPIFIHK